MKTNYSIILGFLFFNIFLILFNPKRDEKLNTKYFDFFNDYSNLLYTFLNL